MARPPNWSEPPCGTYSNDTPLAVAWRPKRDFEAPPPELGYLSASSFPSRWTRRRAVSQALSTTPATVPAPAEPLHCSERGHRGSAASLSVSIAISVSARDQAHVEEQGTVPSPLPIRASRPTRARALAVEAQRARALGGKRTDPHGGRDRTTARHGRRLFGLRTSAEPMHHPNGPRRVGTRDPRLRGRQGKRRPPRSPRAAARLGFYSVAPSLVSR